MWLLPSIYYIDDHTYSAGNPNLDPQKRYNINLDQVFYDFIYLSLQYSYTKGVSGTVLLEKPNNELEYTYLNYADRNMLYTGLAIPFQTSRFSGEFSARGFYQKFVHPVSGIQLPDHNGTFRLSSSLYAKYIIIRPLSVNTYLSYSTKNYGFQFVREPVFTMDIGASYSILKDDKMLLSLSVTDIFNSYKTNAVYKYSNNTRFIDSHTNSQSIRITLSMRFSGGEKMSNNVLSNPNDIDRFRKE
jgi:hypothetical protein